MKLKEAFAHYRELVLAAASARSCQTETGGWTNRLAPVLGDLDLFRNQPFVDSTV